jgi:hypothetical protein
MGIMPVLTGTDNVYILASHLQIPASQRQRMVDLRPQVLPFFDIESLIKFSSTYMCLLAYFPH